MPAKLLFSAADSSQGIELWITDGTAAGTSLVKDINPSGDSQPSYITDLGNGRAVFSAKDGTHSTTTLWVTDGTAAGTSLLNTVEPGYYSAGPYFTAIGNGRAIFAGYTATYGDELWITDGTAGGTSLLLDIHPGSSNSYPANFTLEGNGQVLFTANDGTHGYELWVTDGTAGGTSLLADINPGNNSSTPSGLTPIGNGKTVFAATDAALGRELWVTDGTAGGTSVLKELEPGSFGSDPSGFTVLGNGKILFNANTTPYGTELWVTDGTAAGTSLLADIRPGSAGSFPKYFTSLGNGETVFTADDGTHGTELWVTDGTAGGTSMVLDIAATGSVGSNPREVTSLGDGKAVFSAYESTNGLELWVTDGTASGTSLVKDIYPGAYGSTIQDITQFGIGKAIFGAAADAQGHKLWVTDGTPGGTSIIYGLANFAPAKFTPFTPLCFVAGTRILTPSGEVPIERLAVGDLVTTLNGAARPVCWIGTGRVQARRGHRTAATPVIVRKGALADQVPNRDLHVTKGHSLYFDGALIPVEFLVNHRSILWDDRAQEVTIYHLELASHDVLVANGAPAESYRDDGNRWLFENTNPAWVHPPQPPCAPVLTGGPIVDAIWRRLLERAGPRPGVPLTDEPDLHLLVDGSRVDAGEVAGTIYRFPLNTCPSSVRIVSRDGVPQELGLLRDSRSLGVAVGRIALRNRARVAEFEADHPALHDGFHAFEADNGWRWTNGDAALSPMFWQGLGGATELELQILCKAQYPLGYVRQHDDYSKSW